MQFLKDFKKDMKKAGLESGPALPPTYYHSCGNYVLNRIMTGSFKKGLAAQGRVTDLAGPSGAGKSFVIGNVIREAQKDGAVIMVLDSENALDDDFVSAIGVDPTSEDYMYFDPITMKQVTTLVSNFVTGYAKEFEKQDPDAPKVLIAIDSLDMLLTDTEYQQFQKGESTGDQGQRNKQLKAMLRTFVQAIKHHNIAIVCTSQVYKNQDVKNGEGLWIVSDAVKFSLSQICLLQKLKLKDKTTNVAHGIRMKVEGFKTRFTQPFQTATIEVPYETGMDPYNGIFEVAKELGIIKQSGAWCYMDRGEANEIKWQGKVIPAEHCELVLDRCDALSGTFLDAQISDEDVERNFNEDTMKKQRQEKIAEMATAAKK